MKKITIISILVLSLLAGFSIHAKAIKAYPYPITVTQPDGTSLTIQIHGDEFLNWTTCGSRLVSKGKDGFYYLSSFDDKGYIVTGTTRVASGGMAPLSSSDFTLPSVAIERALQMRSQMMRPASKGGMRLTSSGSGSSISLGNKKFLVLLVQFSDVSFTVDSPKKTFTNLLNQSGYSANNSTGSVRDYFIENSHNLFEPTFEVVGPVTLSNTCYYYGNNAKENERYIEAIVEACQLADKDGVDFSQYDHDGDGVIDNVFYYYAGYNEAEGGGDDTIWPHSWNVGSQRVYLDGKLLDSYACSSEYSGGTGSKRFCGISTFCHEFGHVIGLPDFYDTDYGTNGSAPGLYSYSLMCVGCYNNDGKTPPYLNTIEKNLLGWMDMPTELSHSGSYKLESVSDNKAYIFPTKTEGEFYLIENRIDKGWDHYLPGKFGMLIYHVDQSSNKVKGISASSRWANWDGINSVAGHECFDLVAAKYPENGISESQIPFPGKTGNTNFTGTSSPASKSWANIETGYNLSEIAVTGELVTFKLKNTNTSKLFYQMGYNDIDSPKESYSVGESFVIKLNLSSKVPKSYSFTFDGNAAAEGDEITLTAGEHTIRAILTYDDNSTETLIQLIKVQ